MVLRLQLLLLLQTCCTVQALVSSPSPLKTARESLFQQLKRTTGVWADTADAQVVKGIPAGALDGATTNPSLVWQSSHSSNFNKALIQRVLQGHQGEGATAVDKVACALGLQVSLGMELI